MLTHLRYKPSSASSETVGGAASNAVDGVATIVHEVKKLVLQNNKEEMFV